MRTLIKVIIVQSILSLSLVVANEAVAQGQSAPLPGVTSQANRPGSLSAYQQLPLNVGDAQQRIDDLKNLVKDSRPAQAADVVQQMGEWLADMAEAHQKLSRAFSKLEASKAQAESERQLALKFAGLKNQVMLLKADILIRQSRYPEALGPLVDIVVAEPHSQVGKEAYKKLKEIGFSEAPEVKTALPLESTVPLKPQIALKPPLPVSPAAKAPVVAVTKPIAITKPAAKAISKWQPRVKIAAKPLSKKPSRIIKGSPFGQY